MSDRELLEKAAKAAGYTPARWSDDGRGLLLTGVQEPWNPLEDDGDALRLAMKCGLVWRFFPKDWRYKTGTIEVCYTTTSGEKPIHDEPMSRNNYASIRRAIVRAAALLP